jgi:hypothetical protein
MDQLDVGTPRHRGDPATPVRRWPTRPHRRPGPSEGDRCDPAESRFPRPPDLAPLRCRRTRLLRHRRESPARIGPARTLRTDRHTRLRRVPDRTRRNGVHRATPQQGGAGLPRRHLRWNEQPRRSHQWEQADDRRGIREFDTVTVRHRRQVLSPERVAPDRLTSILQHAQVNDFGPCKTGLSAGAIPRLAPIASSL